jgi:diacylglycerol kinase (ATP)
MKKNKSFSVRTRLRSFRYAFSGLLQFFFEEHNAIVQLLATVIVAILVIYFRIDGTELLALVIVTGGVWVAELLNTAIEQVMNLVSPERHPKVKYIKDLAAAAVLVAALVALITAGIIFIPRLNQF